MEDPSCLKSICQGTGGMVGALFLGAAMGAKVICAITIAQTIYLFV